MISNPFVERSTDTVAIGAVSSPFWLPGLQQVSEVAALLLPIFGVIWLTVQIIGYYRKKGK